MQSGTDAGHVVGIKRYGVGGIIIGIIEANLFDASGFGVHARDSSGNVSQGKAVGDEKYFSSSLQIYPFVTLLSYPSFLSVFLVFCRGQRDL